MKKATLSALAIALILLSGCSPPATAVPEPTATEAPPTEVVLEPTASTLSLEVLIGTWEKDAGTGVNQFNEDGVMVHANSKFVLDSAPLTLGQFRLDGNLLIMTTDEGRICEGITATYAIALTEEGKLYTEVVEDECDDRVTSFHDKLWSRISP